MGRSFLRQFFRSFSRRPFGYVGLWPWALVPGFVVVMLSLSTVRSFRAVCDGPRFMSLRTFSSGERVFPLRASSPAGGFHEDLMVIRLWKRMMDSLKNDSSGRRIYDSILYARPGIMDSARVAEDFFSLHNLFYLHNQ